MLVTRHKPCRSCQPARRVKLAPGATCGRREVTSLWQHLGFRVGLRLSEYLGLVGSGQAYRSSGEGLAVASSGCQRARRGGQKVPGQEALGWPCTRWTHVQHEQGEVVTAPGGTSRLRLGPRHSAL